MSHYVEINPDDEILRLRLPVPLDGLASVTKLVKHVYGTGDVRMRQAGHYLVFTAPAAGFTAGPVSKRTAWPQTNKDEAIAYAAVGDGEADIEIRGESAIQGIVRAAIPWFELHGGVNSVTLTLGVYSEEPDFTFIMQKRNGTTPAELSEIRRNRIDALLEDEAIDVSELRERVREALDFIPDPASA